MADVVAGNLDHRLSSICHLQAAKSIQEVQIASQKTQWILAPLGPPTNSERRSTAIDCPAFLYEVYGVSVNLSTDDLLISLIGARRTQIRCKFPPLHMSPISSD